MAPHHLLTILLALGALPGSVNAAESQRLIVMCDEGRHFKADITEKGATVTLEHVTLRLTFRDSSLGRRFDGPGGVMIIDDRYVALVVNNDLGFHGCRIANPNDASGDAI